jgi:hypothetical protein
MRKYALISLVTLFLSSLATAQTPQKIHDLKSLTDSSGTVHLFYRIFAEYEGTEYFTDNIYHYNTKTGEEKLFLEHFYDTRYGFPYSSAVTDYEFLDNDPQNVVLIRRNCDNECSEFVGRKDSPEGIGGLFVTIDNLNVEGPDSGRVYVEMSGEVIIGRNGGRDWPDVDVENFEQISDSSKLSFPLTSLSPYDDSLMFGRKYFNPDGENAFLRSINKGLTSELISDTLLPDIIEYDADYNTVYIIDRVNAPGYTCTSETCQYGIYVNSRKGEIGHWKQKKLFDNDINLLTHPTVFGKFYVRTTDSVLVSEDYGEHFEVLVKPIEEITGFTATPSSEYFTTNSALYKIVGENSVELFSIPVSNETEMEFPDHFELLQNYPNPFNPSTTITYRMRTSGEVAIELYSIHGQRVKKLVNDFKTEGQHSFRLNGSDLASGIYILRGKMGVQTETRKITLIK